jgi:hypothetical protein
MAYVKFNTVACENQTAWGYPITSTNEGVFGEVPEDMLQSEINAGRVSLIKQTPQDVIENGSGKRMGRTMKSLEVFE